MASRSPRPTDPECLRKIVAGRQFYKCANAPGSKLLRLEKHKCPCWLRAEHAGSFDEAGYELDHVDERAGGGDDGPDNRQALCPSCHAVKTRYYRYKVTCERKAKASQEEEKKLMKDVAPYGLRYALIALTVKQLRVLCKRHGAKGGKLKADIIDRLMNTSIHLDDLNVPSPSDGA